MAPLGRLAGSTQLRLALGLPLRNREGLALLLQRLYDPASPQYHRFLTPVQFTAQFGPSEQDYQAVVAFARNNGLPVTATHPNRVVVDVCAPAFDLERVFHVRLFEYAHPRESRRFYAPDSEPSADLAVPLLSISGLDNYALPRPASVCRPPTDVDPRRSNFAPQDNTGTGPGGTYAGWDFRDAYCRGVTLDGTGQSVGLLQFDGYYPSDVTTYEGVAALPSVTLVDVLINGGVSSPGSGNLEVCLDIAMALSMAPGLSAIYVYQAPNPSPWVDLLSRMANDNLAHQLSCSWYGGPPDATSEQIFLQMAAQGQSFFNASGDLDAFIGWIPFPSGSPHITQVGGTTLTTDPSLFYTSETVWNWGLHNGNYIGSSGGISTYYPIPTWQQEINMSACGGSTFYRNVPDVALTADNVYVTYNNGDSTTVGGTSCAAPLWAGFIALANQQAASYHQPPVGFINPAVYAIGTGSNYASCFHDITNGDNTWPSSPNQFHAVPGYDLCTGWGTPQGRALIDALAPMSSQPLIQAAGSLLLAESCTPTNGVVDPGETVTLAFSLRNFGAAFTTNLVATLQATGGVLCPSGSQAYGVLRSLGTSVARPFTFTADGVCGATVTATLQLQDGPADLGTVSFALPLGRGVMLITESFDAVTAPALPLDWTTDVSDSGVAWVTTKATCDTAPNAAFEAEPVLPGVGELISPPLSLPATPAQLIFRHSYSLEANPADSTKGYDGGVLEIQVGADPFADILAAGGSFVTGGYTRTIDVTDDNPLGGRQAWSGSSAGWITTMIDLPPAAANQTIQLKWRLGTDTANGYGGTGWYLDTIAIQAGYSCCENSNLLTAPVIDAHNFRTGPTNFSLSLTSAAGATYMLQYKTHLTDSTWLSLPPGTPGNGGTITLRDTNVPTSPSRFYRVHGY